MGVTAVAELEDMINSVLSDPEQMNKIMGMAQSLMGGESQSQPREENRGVMDGLDPKMLSKLRQLMGGAQRPGESEALLRAMQPYLSEKRRVKMDKALKLARFAKLAGFAMEELGGDKE